MAGRRSSPSVRHPKIAARLEACGLRDVKVRDFKEGLFASGFWDGFLICLAARRGEGYDLVAVHDLEEPEHYEQGRLM